MKRTRERSERAGAPARKRRKPRALAHGTRRAGWGPDELCSAGRGASPVFSVRARMRADRFAARAGIRLVALRPGYARAVMRLSPEHLNGVGIAQGGALFTLADLAFAAAANSHGAVAVALDVSITFLRGLSKGALTAEAREVSRSRRVSVCEVTVKGRGGVLVALFRGTAFRKEEAAAGGEAPAATRRRRSSGRRAQAST